jgi:hypothetical protein
LVFIPEASRQLITATTPGSLLRELPTLFTHASTRS